MSILLLALALPSFARNTAQKKQLARTQFDTAERMREELNGRPVPERTRNDYQKVTDAYRRVYYTAPTSSKADAAVVAVAELLTETGRRFNEPRTLNAAIGQYEFLRREYPGSKYRIDALFTMAQIYKSDLGDAVQAKATFQEYLKHYPRSRLASEAKAAIAELDQPSDKRRKEPEPHESVTTTVAKNAPLPLVTGIRHWSTPTYTRVAIDLENEVQYQAGRVPSPNRIFFDLHETKLASTLVGKTFDVEDGLLRKIRVAQFLKGITRVVLEVDDLSDYSAFLLPNPYRLIIDIHGRQAKKLIAKAPANPKPDTGKTTVAPGSTKPETVASVEEPRATNNVTTVRPPVVDPKTEKRAKAAETKPTVKPAPELTSAKAELTPKEKTKAEASDDDASDTTTVARLNPPELSSSKPTSAPTFESVAPRAALPKGKRRATSAAVHEARPTANGERSLIRALGLKIGRIVVDAGHGGHDTGTIGPDGLQEKDLVLDVALRMGKLLESKLGAAVIYTRDDDTFVPLETRTAIANQHQADLFISIHANSSNDASARGIETYYLNFTSSADALEVAARENAVSQKSIHELQDLVKKIALKEKIEESREFAADVQNSLWSGVAAKIPAIRNRGVKKAPFIVLIGANMPSVLAEISFLSNPSDERKLQTPEHRQKIAEYLAKGISRYVSGLSGIKVARTSSDTVQ